MPGAWHNVHTQHMVTLLTVLQHTFPVESLIFANTDLSLISPGSVIKSIRYPQTLNPF